MPPVARLEVLHPHFLPHRQPSTALPCLCTPPPADDTLVVATVEGGERNLLTPTVKRTAAVFDLPIAASGFSATTVPHAAVAATFTTTTDTSDDDIDQSPVENVPKKYVC